MGSGDRKYSRSSASTFGVLWRLFMWFGALGVLKYSARDDELPLSGLPTRDRAHCDRDRTKGDVDHRDRGHPH